MKPYLITVIPVIFFSSLTVAQMPQTDIYFLNYELSGSNLKIESIRKISKGSGYNNQPFIAPGCESVYYTSNVFDSSQTEILRYDHPTESTTRITNTELSEYSPCIRPAGANLSLVRVESDLKQHLRLISDTTGGTQNMVPASDSVGYYAWNGSEYLGLILLNKGLEFHTYRKGDSNTMLVSDSVGRFIAAAKNATEFWYHSKSDKNPQLISFDFVRKSETKRLPTLQGCDDYGIDKNGNVFGALNGTLYQFNDTRWKPLIDLNKYTGHFYRLSFCECGGHMCVVGFTGKKP